jgi:hypothetical protein
MSTPNLITRELPRYRCTKEVSALKIAKIVFDADVAQREGRGTDGSATLYPAEKGYLPILVDREWVMKHQPKAGGYWVLYKDGYTSWSPALAFDEGYVRIEP